MEDRKFLFSYWLLNATNYVYGGCISILFCLLGVCFIGTHFAKILAFSFLEELIIIIIIIKNNSNNNNNNNNNNNTYIALISILLFSSTKNEIKKHIKSQKSFLK